MGRYFHVAIGLAIGIGLIDSAAFADMPSDAFKLSGNLRLYSFSRNYTNSPLADLHSTSLGGKVKIEASSQEGVGAGLAGYFAQDIGFNNHDQNNKYINPLLMGTNYGIYVPGEAYIQYKAMDYLVRIGNQVIDNPWINPSDGFMIPNLYRGGIFTYNLSAGMQIELDRITQFKNRTSPGFDGNTLFALPYDNPHFTGSSNGAAAIGMNYKGDSLSAKTWVYRFYDFAQMAYVQGGYQSNPSGMAPFGDVQYLRETGDGAQMLGAVDSRAYGAKIGLTFPAGTAYLAYNKVPARLTAGISNGNLLSPYTQVYNTDPLYTTIMNYGLVSARAAGSAWQIGINLKALENKLDASASISRYLTAPYVANVNALLLDLAYHLDGQFKALTIRNRLGYEQGLATWGSHYLDNRIMLQYAF